MPSRLRLICCRLAKEGFEAVLPAEGGCGTPDVAATDVGSFALAPGGR